MDDRNTYFFNLGDCVVHKNAVATILPLKGKEQYGN